MLGNVLVVPEVILAAATELDLLATRLEVVHHLSAPATHVLPQGSEEVSWLSAGYFNRAAATFEPASAKGIAELRLAAETLRTQLAGYIAQDVANAAATAVGLSAT